jgi:hypothetical protein
MQNILAHYPWREYGYKYGRWQKVGTLLSDITAGETWGKVFNAFVLVDLVSGQEVGEMTAAGVDGFPLVKYSGSLWFAGEPAVAGVYTPAGDGVRNLKFVRSPYLHLPSVNDHALVMRPGFNPELPRSVPGLNPRLKYDPNNKYRDDSYAKQKGPWVVDHPEKPPKSELR